MKWICFLIIILPITVFAQENRKNTYAIMVGPMVHFYKYDHKIHASYGLEASYWGNFPVGIDLGAEWERGKIRIYTEMEAGILFAGAAIGPVYQYNYKLKENNFGLQGSLWANAFLGFDARWKRLNHETIFSPGTYLKLPAFSDIDLHNE